MPAIIKLPDSLKLIKAIILDFDGTVINPPKIDWNGMKRAVYEFLRKMGIILKRRSSFLADITSCLLRACSSQSEFFRVRKSVYDIITKFEMEGIKYPITPTKNISHFLKTIKKMSLKTAIFSSNSREFIIKVLEKISLIQYFDIIVSRDDVLWPKPNPEGILKICKVLNVNPNNCVVIGDLPYDIVAARKAGCIPIGVLSGRGTKEELLKAGAIFVFPCVQEILSVLQPLDISCEN